MQKLYQKSEIWFAVIWIFVYVAGASAADSLSIGIGIEKAVTLPFLAALCAIALIWMGKYDLYRRFGLCRPQMSTRRLLYYVPLLLMASCNLWFGINGTPFSPETWLYIGSMVCVGFLEELIFRGFLFKAMSKDSLKAAVIVSSVTFGIGHIINLFNGSGAQLVSNFCQVAGATAIGFLFVILFLKSGSLLPCIITHSAINALSAVENQQSLSTMREILVAGALIAISVLYAWYLCKLHSEKRD